MRRNTVVCFMPIEFRDVSSAPLQNFSGLVPKGALVGVVGLEQAGPAALLDLTSGRTKPSKGNVASAEPRRTLGPTDKLDFTGVQTLCLNQTLALRDGLARRQAILAINRLRRAGASLLYYSNSTELLRQLADEVWWFEEGRLTAKGDPREVLERYERSIARQWLDWSRTLPAGAIDPSLRRGDGRAEITGIETLNREEEPTQVWQSGQLVSVRVRVRYQDAVPNPVLGIMIRTRIGMEVYGTNTELEKVTLGPVRAGETLQVTFSFVCHLCPQEYTLTVASHDPDGIWHEWLEDAVAFAVADTRYTAGVANLRADVAVDRL